MALDLAELLGGCIAYRQTVQEDDCQRLSFLVARDREHYLVEEDIFAVSTFSRKVFEVAVLVDAMFQTQLLPKLRTHCISLLAFVTILTYIL